MIMIENTTTTTTTTTTKTLVTIFDDPVNYNCLHPLARKWTLHFDSPTKKISDTNWAENIKNIYTFDNVEHFWGIFNNIIVPSNIKYGSNYYFFKENIKPMWEDPSNENGGKWCIQFKKESPEHVNKTWLHMLLYCIGEIWHDEIENYNYTDDICGIIVNIRKYQDKVNIWIKDKSNKKSIEYIGNKIKEHLADTDTDATLSYSDHK